MKEDQDDILQLVIKIGSSKPELRVEGLNMVHPMYEALAALLRKNLSDREIVEHFAKDEASLKSVLVADAVLDSLEPSFQTSLKALLMSGASLGEIVDRAALYISEGKRSADNKVLNRAAPYARRSRYFMAAVQKASPENVYIESSELERTVHNAEVIRRRRIASWIAIPILTMGLLGYIGSRGCDPHTGKEDGKPVIESKAEESSYGIKTGD